MQASQGQLFTSREEVKTFFLHVIATEAEAKGEPLSEYEKEFLQLSSPDLFTARNELAERFGREGALNSVERLVLLLQGARHRDAAHLHSSGATLLQLIEAGKKVLVSTEDSLWIVLRDASSSFTPRGERKVGAILAIILFAVAMIYAVLRANRKFGLGAAAVVVGIFIVAFVIDRLRQPRKA